MTDLHGWRDQFVRDSDLRRYGARAQLVRAIRSGNLSRVSRGVYSLPIDPTLPRHRVAELTHRNRILSFQLTQREAPVFSHDSAALLWGLPRIEPWPDRVHVSTGAMSGGRSTTLVVRHGVDCGEPALVGDLRLTALPRTVVDLARTSTFRQGVSVADAALHGLFDGDGRVIRAPVSKEQLFDELMAAGHGRGVAQARAVIDFADGLSGSPGESCSRVGFMQLGLPAPVLQQAFFDRYGLIGYGDFWWPGSNLIGEFDGKSKYSDPAFLRGRTPEQALADEKRREDRLRAPGRGVSRWGWGVALSLPRLRTHLFDAGLR